MQKKTHVPITTYWNGAPCQNCQLHAHVTLDVCDSGDMDLTASLPHQPSPNIPTAPQGTRVANLWEYDVVECFLVGQDGSYIEVEFGAGGHYLLLGFSAPRVRSRSFEDLQPDITFDSGTKEGVWTSSILLPKAILPSPIVAINAFVIVRDHFLAYHPVPGDVPDFHQPSTFPAWHNDQGFLDKYPPKP